MQAGSFTILASSSTAVAASNNRTSVTIYGDPANGNDFWVGFGQAAVSGPNRVTPGGWLTCDGAMAQQVITTIGASGNVGHYQES
jgi:hypothetical protein